MVITHAKKIVSLDTGVAKVGELNSKIYRLAWTRKQYTPFPALRAFKALGKIDFTIKEMEAIALNKDAPQLETARNRRNAAANAISFGFSVKAPVANEQALRASRRSAQHMRAAFYFAALSALAYTAADVLIGLGSQAAGAFLHTTVEVLAGGIGIAFGIVGFLWHRAARSLEKTGFKEQAKD